jgi:hypothetical protein
MFVQIGSFKRIAKQAMGRGSYDDLFGAGQCLQPCRKFGCAAYRQLCPAPAPAGSPTTTGPVAMPIRTARSSVHEVRFTV